MSGPVSLAAEAASVAGPAIAAVAAPVVDTACGIRLSWPAPMSATRAPVVFPATLAPTGPDALPMMRGWTLPTPLSIPSLPT